LDVSSGALIGTLFCWNNPSSVAVDAVGNIWVANSSTYYVSKLNGSSGALIGTYPTGN